MDLQNKKTRVKILLIPLGMLIITALLIICFSKNKIIVDILSLLYVLEGIWMGTASIILQKHDQREWRKLWRK